MKRKRWWFGRWSVLAEDRNVALADALEQDNAYVWTLYWRSWG